MKKLLFFAVLFMAGFAMNSSIPGTNSFLPMHNALNLAGE